MSCYLLKHQTFQSSVSRSAGICAENVSVHTWHCLHFSLFSWDVKKKKYHSAFSILPRDQMWYFATLTQSHMDTCSSRQLLLVGGSSSHVAASAYGNCSDRQQNQDDFWAQYFYCWAGSCSCSQSRAYRRCPGSSLCNAQNNTSEQGKTKSRMQQY